MPEFPSAYHDLFEKKTFAHFATIMPSGFPHVTPVWIDLETNANRILVNTALGRQKHVNVEENPKVGLSMTDPDDAYRALSVYGEVDHITEENAKSHIDSLEQRYLGNDTYHGDRSNRVILEIRPDYILTR